MKRIIAALAFAVAVNAQAGQQFWGGLSYDGGVTAQLNLPYPTNGSVWVCPQGITLHNSAPSGQWTARLLYSLNGQAFQDWGTIMYVQATQNLWSAFLECKNFPSGFSSMYFSLQPYGAGHFSGATFMILDAR